MSGHTKEPWHVVDADFGDATTRYIDDEFGADGGRDYYLATVENGDPIELDANTRRIVACVNACAGISTKSLEAEEKLNEMFRRVATEHLKQRDELLAALISARAAHALRTWDEAALTAMDAAIESARA